MRFKYLFLLLPFICFASCKKETSTQTLRLAGQYSYPTLLNKAGFQESNPIFLSQNGISHETFISLSTDSAWSMKATDCTLLKTIREAIEKPTAQTLLQKVISLNDVPTYMNNTYGGTVGGFVCAAADTKGLNNQYNIYWGLRLDYPNTKFSPQGAGYAVIRFKSPVAGKLTIPYCDKMGGSVLNPWPWTGGGFTSSKLGKGGYPEYTFLQYSAPEPGAELYEVTPNGTEILRSTFIRGAWTTNQEMITKSIIQPVRNGLYNNPTKSGQIFVTTRATYKGFPFIVRGLIDNQYHITTTDHKTANKLGLKTIEKGIYGTQVPVNMVNDLREDIENF